MRWNKLALIDFNPDHWWATSKKAVKVKDVTGGKTDWGDTEKTVYFETPIETNWSGPTTHVFERWVEHCCSPNKK